MSITLHFQRIPDWFGEFVSRCQGQLEYIVGVDVFPNVPGVKVLGRTYLPDGESNALVDRGAPGADEWIDRFAHIYAGNPHVYKWIGPNEYVLWDQGAVDRFNAFHVQFIQRMSALGHSVVCGQINTGWPRLRLFNDPPPYPEALAPTLAALWAHEGLFSLHEYGPGDMRTGAGAHCLRYKNTRIELLAAGVVNLPDFIITETGIDVPDLAAPQGHRGWRDFTDWPGYFDQLKWYSGELDQDDYMLGASIFTVADDWATFQINREEAMPLAGWIASGEPPPPPERARGIDVSQWQGEIDWQAVAADGIEFVFIRATVGLRTDPYFTQNWTGAGEAGLLRGVYHYLETGTPGQAKHFVETIDLREPELGYWADLEHGDLSADKCRGFLEAVDHHLNYLGDYHCDVYTSRGFFDRFGSPEWVDGRWLWVAHWTDAPEPTLPAAWDEWEFWQQTSQGSVAGIEGRVDLDVYNGTAKDLYSIYGNGGNGSMELRVFDNAGNEQTWDWLTAKYGDVQIQQPDADSYFKVIEIHERHADSAFIAKVLNADGTPKFGKTVLFYWDTAPAAPGSGWLEQGVGGVTNENGDVGFGMGSGAWYTPPEQGPHKAWLFGENVSEMVEGIGMRIGPDGPTNHDHFNVTWQYVENGNGNGNGNGDGDLADVVTQLKRIADAAEHMAAHWPFAG